MNQQSPVRSGTAALTLAARRRLWRHWHQPALRLQGGIQRAAMALNQQNAYLRALSALFWAVNVIIW